MAAVRTIEEMSKDPAFWGYYSIEEAHQQELEDAKETGYDEGSKEAKIETAKALLSLGILTHEQIAYSTGLEIDEIIKLKEITKS